MYIPKRKEVITFDFGTLSYRRVNTWTKNTVGWYLLFFQK